MTTTEYHITLAFVLTLFTVAFFVAAQYGILSPWWTHRTGIGLFTTLFGLMVVSGLTAWAWFWNLNLYVAWAAWGLLIAALLFMSAVIGVEQFRGQRLRKVWHAIRRKFRRNR